MSHTRILDKIRQRFVNLPSAEAGLETLPRKRHKRAQKLHNEYRQKGHFNCKAFVDVSTEMIRRKISAALNRLASVAVSCFATATSRCATSLLARRTSVHQANKVST